MARDSLTEDDRIELLDGELWEMSPHGTPHAATVHAVQDALGRAFGEGYGVRGQLPFALDDVSEPEPDALVVRGAPFDYLDEHPTQPLLVVEVADSSLGHDRGRKLAAYARNGVPEYWILDLEARRLEVHRDPERESFASVTVLTRDDTVSPLQAPDAAIRVAQMLPP